VHKLIPSMLRRLRNWDYHGRAFYMISIVLEDRRRHLLGEVNEAKMIPSALGMEVEACWNSIPQFHPQIQIIASQLMPEHFHGILYVREQMDCHLGKVIAGFKLGCNRAYARLFPANPLPPRKGVFAPGFQDTVLLHEGQLQAMIDYVHDNPRRLWEKMQHRDFFTILQKAMLPGIGCLQAVGNLSLLKRPARLQVQISRSDFRYQRDTRGLPLKELPPQLQTPAFLEAQETLLEAARHGAVLVSPCLSDGEKAIARAALQANAPLIALRSTGFSPYYKPEGQYFDACADGRLLMLAPGAWQYSTQKKPLTREEAWILNRIAQLICGDGAADIHYHGSSPEDIDQLVAKATEMPSRQ